MCEAVKDMINESRQEGKVEGKAEGRIEGREEGKAEGKIYAPTDGEVTLVFDTLHAVGMTSSMGTEILIHIGLDTVTLGGEPFTAHVAAGDKVKKGDLLVEVDLDKIKAAGLNSITPVLISNTDTYDKISLQKEGDVLFDEAVLKIL